MPSRLAIVMPLVGFEVLGIAPYLVGLVAATASVSAALRARWFGLALVAPASVLIVSVAFGVYNAQAPWLIGAAFTAVALAWAAWRTRRAARQRQTEALDPSEARRAARAVPAVLAITALLGASAAGAAAASVSPIGEDRRVLRDYVVPPLELYDFPSPLTNFRKYVTSGEDTTLFTVEGLPEGAPVRLATLDAYDGVVYSVAGAGGDGSGVFTRVGRDIENDVVGEPVSLEVAIADLDVLAAAEKDGGKERVTVRRVPGAATGSSEPWGCRWG